MGNLWETIPGFRSVDTPSDVGIENVEDEPIKGTKQQRHPQTLILY